MAARLNLVWTDDEKNFIRQNAARVKDADLAIKLSRLTGRHVSLNSVRKARQRLGIHKMPGRGSCYVKPSPSP